MQKYFPILKKCPLFEGIAPEDLSGLLVCLGARVIYAQKGQTVLQEGTLTNSIGIILTGSVHLVQSDYYGNRSIVTQIGPAQLFGEAYAFSAAQTLPVSIVAEEDSNILMLDSHRFTASCSKACSFHNRVITNLLYLVSDKILMLHQKIQVTSQRTTRSKLMAYLNLQAKIHGSSTFSIPFDRQTLADYLEVDRSGLSAEISKLRAEGILESDRNQFRLL